MEFVAFTAVMFVGACVILWVLRHLDYVVHFSVSISRCDDEDDDDDDSESFAPQPRPFAESLN